MNKSRLLILTAVGALGAGALSGCVSLLPKTKPAQLYRFGYTPAQGEAPALSEGDAAARVGVIFLPPNLPRPAGNDQLLTYTGDQAAYIGESRWVAPAFTLFQGAVEDAFTTSARVRLAKRSDAGSADVSLRVDVSRFETVYATPGAIPRVRVTFRATLLLRDGSFAGDRVFTDTEAATDNRVGPIVNAYEAAVSKTLGELVDWTERQAPGMMAQQRGPRPALPNPAPPLSRVRGASSTNTTSTSSTTVTVPR